MQVKFVECPACKGTRKSSNGLSCALCAGTGWKLEVIRKEESCETTKSFDGEGQGNEEYD